METGHLPETLDVLVPEFLKKIPLDPYDGKPLRYRMNQRVVYSIAGNLSDDGGDTGGDYAVDDITVGLGLPLP